MISIVSVVGIMIPTAALVIILSGFNGIEQLVVTLVSSFEPDIEIESAQTKTFNTDFIPDKVFQVDGLAHYSKVIEEIAIIKNDEQFVIGSVKGVEESFLEISNMQDHLLDGENRLYLDAQPLGLVGAGVLENLGAFIYESDFPQENFTLYVPNKNEKISRTNLDAFTTSRIPIVGTFSFNNEIDHNYLVVPLDYASEVLNYKNEITGLEMDFEDGVNLESKKEELQGILGPSFTVKTVYEQNEMIFKTSRSEKWMVTMLLTFIFFLATFNLVASITMLVIEKRNNMQTLYSLGARKTQLQRIFFYEGLLINWMGVILGLLIGYGVCMAQQQFGFISLENSPVEYFPIKFKLSDLFVILSVALSFGLLATYLPSKFLIKRIIT
ncbi:MAG: FtsX-like permease family protein [Crocinitomicaceae bacterium]|nr:FtsX-like permease family protein [Crocinitomicaceae bacterium]